MALRNLKQIYPDIVYICIGYGDEEDNIKSLVKELDLNAQVMFFKDISDDLKNALVAKSNIFVMPSVIHKSSVEGFGIAYTEAAQYGIPSIGGKDGGAADAIEHEKTGLICDGNNLDDIYSSLNSMIENKKYIELGNHGGKGSHSLKFDSLFNKADELGAEFIATGHHAKVTNNDGKYNVEKASDQNKDQSYVLFTLSQEKLKRLLFPVGNYSKGRWQEGWF